ncbi:MAG: hypothetical protein Q4G27_09035 [Flavobacteriaceae bacterium]|nr:hypothetical protein [Flavobacteriaceae bacterium]
MKLYIFLLTFIISGIAWAQIQQGQTTVNREEDFTQESVTVERNYEPKVEAAEKIKQTPKIDPTTGNKLSVDYSLKDVEAESDFETTTIGAEELPVKDQSPYNNYIRAGYGNRATLLIDGFGEYALDQDKSVGAAIDYRSTNGYIKEMDFSTNNSKLAAEGFFKMNFENALADIRLGGGMHKLNYYGIPENQTFSAPADVAQRYSNLYVNGKYKAYNHLFLDEIKLNAGFFGDIHDATETNFDVFARVGNNKVLELNTFNDLALGISADLNLNVTNSKFKLPFSHDFSLLNTGIAPQIHFQNEILKVSAGANLQYNNESTLDISEFHIFPKAEVFVTAVPEFGFYGGITGGILQNRYQSFYHKNPYLLPNQHLTSTINKMEVYAGIRGDIGANFKYDASAKYQNLDNIPFMSRYYGFGEPYMSANSFYMVYDNGKKSVIEGNINYLGISNLNLGANLLLQTFTLDNFEEAWGESPLKATISGDYKLLDERLILGTDVFYVDKRKFLENRIHVNGQNEILNVDPYVDVNFNATYLILDRWAAFIELNNVLNKNYERFVDYPVHGITAVGGIMFKF